MQGKSEKLKKLRWEGYPPKGNFKIAEKWKYMAKAPFKISEKCCDVMKKKPFKDYEKTTGKTPIIGTMAKEGRLRFQEYEQHGCNAFDLKRPKSTPIAFWTDSDIWDYIKQNKIEYSTTTKHKTVN